MVSDDQEWFDRFLADPPAGLEEAAAIVAEAEAAREAGDLGPDPEADGAVLDVLGWLEARCDGFGYEGRHILPPADALPAGMEICGAASVPLDPSDLAEGITIYGDATVEDPYDAPMVAVAWAEGSGGFGGDGEQTPVEVRGGEGTIAPITVFQQTVPEGMGQVVTWTEGDGPAMGVYGRWWVEGQRDELVAIADAVEVVDGRYVVPPETLPPGLTELHSGSLAPLQLLGPSGSEGGYLASLQGSDGDSVSVFGFLSTPEEFEAMRFLTLDVGPTTIDGRSALSGHAWSEDHPAIVAMRSDDGSTVRFTGLGSDLAEIEELAASARPLDPEEWGQVVSSGPC